MSVEAIGQALLERLRERLQETGHVAYVYSAGEYAHVEERSQFTPAAAVIYNGYQPGDEVGQGVQQAVDLEFLVVLVTRNTAGFGRGAGAQEDVSPIFDALLPAVLGWRPKLADGVFPSPFRLAPAPGASVSGEGFAYWPVAFTIRRTYRGTP